MMRGIQPESSLPMQMQLAQDAVQAGRIHVEGSKLQEEARQQVTLQQLRQQQVGAELAVLDQEKSHALATLHAENPVCVSLQIALANAQTIKETEKLICTWDGVVRI